MWWHCWPPNSIVKYSRKNNRPKTNSFKSKSQYRFSGTILHVPFKGHNSLEENNGPWTFIFPKLCGICEARNKFQVIPRKEFILWCRFRVRVSWFACGPISKNDNKSSELSGIQFWLARWISILTIIVFPLCFKLEHLTSFERFKFYLVGLYLKSLALIKFLSFWRLLSVNDPL